jgi:DNA polymerase III subunit epsilon
MTDWIAIDFETANELRSSPCALGLAVIRDGRIAEERSWLIKPPEVRFTWWNTRVHGIKAEDVEDAPELCEIHDELMGYLDGAHVLAHNAGFDAAVLGRTLDVYGLAWPDVRYWCTVHMARKVWPHLPNHKLDSVAGHCGIALRHHDAASDARVCAQVALRCADELGAPTLDAAVEALGLAGRPL